MADVDAFGYGGLEIDTATGTLRCAYELGEYHFEETISVGGGGPLGPAALEAARIAYLLAGVSYYKSAAPPVVDLGETAIDESERRFLRRFYVDGLGEFAYRNGLDLGELVIRGGRARAGQPRAGGALEEPVRPLVPFGGGIDSIVTVEMVKRRYPQAALFVLNRPGDRFAAIEKAAAVTGLPVVRAERELDPLILRSSELGLLNGHVPITGILSAIAVTAAAAGGYDAVVMSNEWSASSGNVVSGGRTINHQWSKSLEFEEGFASVVDRALGGGVRYFSALRPWSELWIAERFSHLDDYHLAFRSCNRAFAMEPSRRLDRWCGTCDKCCFIDLILAPFVPVERLQQIFAGSEPLENHSLMGRFRTLLGLSPDLKPWECVGDVDECRAAAALAYGRGDRAGNPLLRALVAECGASASAPPADLLAPRGRHHVPDAIAPAALVV